MSITLRGKNNEIVLEPVFRDADGNETKELGGVPAWSSSNPDVLALVAAEDGLSAVATPTGLVGTAQIQLLVDSDPGEVEVVLIGTLDVEVKAGLAVLVQLNPTIRAVAPVVVPEPEPEVPVIPEPEVPADPQPEVPANPQPEVPAEPEAPVGGDEQPADPAPADPAPGDEGGEAGNDQQRQ